MRVLIHAAIAFSVALMPIGDADAAKGKHKSHPVHFTRGAVQSTPGDIRRSPSPFKETVMRPCSLFARAAPSEAGAE